MTEKLPLGERLRRILDLIPLLSALGPALRKLWENWQEFAWLLVMGGILYGAFLLMPYIDPRSGIDGFGSLFAYGLLAFKGMMVAFSAWLCKRIYWHDLSREEEAALRTAALAGDKNARNAILFDRMETAAWLVFWSFVFFS